MKFEHEIDANGEKFCWWHPSRDPEWDGYGWVCPSCVLGCPPESEGE